MEQTFLKIVTLISNNFFPAMVGATVAVVIIMSKIVIPYIFSIGNIEIFASIAGLYRGNVIEIDAGETEKVIAGNIFTVYKRLQIRDISDERCGLRRGRYYYKPVAQLKVISTTRKNALCKYRPIRGYSANPSVGDTVFYSSKFASGKVIPYPAS
jgi:hypothetical protein